MLDDSWPGPLEVDAAGASKIRQGKGLIWRCLDTGMPIYQRRLSMAEVKVRINQCWRPYHAALANAVQAACRRHGYSIHLNCHSMPAVASAFSTDFPGLAHADFVVGDRDGTAADTHASRIGSAHIWKAWVTACRTTPRTKAFNLFAGMATRRRSSTVFS